MILLEIFFWTLSATVIYTYVGYFLLLRLLCKFRTQKRNRELVSHQTFENAQKHTIISLVIPAYNEEDVIQEKIENCLWLDYDPKHLEVLICSDGSNDRTNEIAQAYADRFPFIKLLIFHTRRGKNAMFNEVIPQCKGEIVVLSDTSAILSIDCLKVLAQHFIDPTVGCVGGTYRLFQPGDGNRGEGEGAYWRYETEIKCNQSKVHSLVGAHGAVYAIRKELYPQLCHNTINDDYVIPVSIVEQGFRALYETDAIGVELSEANIEGEFKRRSRIMAGNFQLIALLRKFLNPKYGFICFHFVSNKVLRAVSPLLQPVVLCLNLVLADESLFYAALLVLQIFFYMLALMGFLFSKKMSINRLLSFPFYFNFGNLATFVGFYRFLLGKQSVKWNRPT